MKRLNFLAALGVGFLLLSAIIYGIHFAIFRDSYFIFKYMIASLGFLPINVFLVTFVLNSLMGNREKQSRMKKLNMVIGAFFSDVGTDLLRILASFDMQREQLHEVLSINKNWTDEDFSIAKTRLMEMSLSLEKDSSHLMILKDFLLERRADLLRLLENTSLLEHESFSNLLWAASHLSDELMHRKDLHNLYPTDLAHLTNDANRIYVLLLLQWVDYMNHLKHKYPYLFSLAVRTNPFTPNVSVEIKEE